jgi:hypothetical protein
MEDGLQSAERMGDGEWLMTIIGHPQKSNLHNRSNYEV